jgi:toxin CcdB
MAHLDVYPNRDPRTSKSRPYAIDIQSNLLASMPSAVLVPLARMESVEELPILRLNPSIIVGDEKLVMLTQDMAAVLRRTLSAPVSNVASQRDEILAALDFLFSGF